ncbi:hypothetical protein E2C01_029950 [Portunus trituberculatus]|uniref:Uncharacterized protein n=1 Tax=Portunus trituberculatus TaxID=210409 RepID=A0A5B7EP83_PORTR|nr:hypothetical protein [Portunus trituberculatus]
MGHREIKALAENAEKLAKINEEVVKIRREAIDLVQAHQIINELQRQVDASCNRVTTLEEKKTLARGRMRSLLAEETILSQNMKASVTKVCAEQKEHAVEMNEKFHILWSNVELLLGCCDMLLKLTRPEVEALKLDGHQADASNRIQTVSSHSQIEIRDDHSQVVSAEAQADISQVHSLGQDVTQHEDFSQRVDSLASSLTERDHKNHILSVGGDNQLDGGNTEVFLEPIADEDQHERDTVTDKQDIENHILSAVDGNQFDGENTEICLEAIADEDQQEKQVEESSALAHEVMEIDASMKQIEDSTQQEKSDSSSAYQGKCILNSSAILSAEEDSSHNTALNNNSPATQTPITTVVMTAEDIPLTNKLSTTAPLHFSQTGGNIVMPSEKQLQDVEVPDLDKQISCNISSASLVSEQTDKQPTGSVSQVKEHESLSNYSSQQDKS